MGIKITIYGKKVKLRVDVIRNLSKGKVEMKNALEGINSILDM